MTADWKANEERARLRRAARLAAVQALYQMEIGGRGASAVVREWREHRFGGKGEAPDVIEADEPYFETIVTGAVEHQRELDAIIAGRLASGWKLERIDSIVRAALRAGSWELLHGDAPKAVVIDEYVDVMKAFFDGPEPGFVNATLDAISKERP
jgi:N utilization substance protein B